MDIIYIMSMNGRTEYLDLQPSNVVSTGLVSYRAGNPVIQFIIGEQDRYLVGQSLRFCGNIQIFKNSGKDIPLATDDVNISPKLGMLGIIDQIVLSSQRSKNVIEHIRYFGRWAASYYANIASKGEAMGHLSESSLMLPNRLTSKTAVVDNVNGSASTNRAFTGSSFAVNLPTGLLSSSSPIGLSGKGWGVGGLLIEIHLTPDSQFIKAPALPNAFYELSNLKLICEVVTPSVDELSRLMTQTSNVMEYNAISSYFTSINSTNAIINFGLGLSRVLSVFCNFIPSAQLNSLEFDGFQTTPLINARTAAAGSTPASATVAPIKQLTFLKGGLKLPLQYSIDCNVRDLPTSTVSDPQIVRNFQNAFMPFMKNLRNQISPITNNRLVEFDTTEYADAGLNFGIGVSYDNISGEGVNFTNDNFGINMETGLQEDNPHACFIFVRSKQTLAMNANGLQVIL